MPDRPNVLLITVDDMNFSAVGCLAPDVPDVTPNIDRLASEGMTFRCAHVTVAICQPSRQAMMTGRYPHNSDAPGFDPIGPDVPTLQQHLSRAGYYNAIVGKSSHLAPPESYCWDESYGRFDLGAGRDPNLYYQKVVAAIHNADEAGKPFFLMANSHDPHRPFHGADDEKTNWQTKDHLDRIPAPSKVYGPDEITVPGFLPDLPDVRKEVAQYYSSCRRCDDAVGRILQALDDSGHRDDTLVMFLSDNGMAFPFAKANVYLNSTRTPWIVRWPGRIQPGRVDDSHMINGIDYAPTICEVCDLGPMEAIDGVSFAGLLSDPEADGRSSLVTHLNTLSSKRAYPMRAIQTPRYGYLYNAWADGECTFRNESMSGLTWPAMAEAAKADAQIASRAELFLRRKPEELYDFAVDPDALCDLVDTPDLSQEKRRLQELLLAEMRRSGDPLTDVFERFLGV